MSVHCLIKISLIIFIFFIYMYNAPFVASVTILLPPASMLGMSTSNIRYRKNKPAKQQQLSLKHL